MTQTVKCPFDPDHIMPLSRLQLHIIKCNAPNKDEFTKCKYNVDHIIKKTQINFHYTKCIDKIKYQKQKKQKANDDEDDDWSVQQSLQKNIKKQNKGSNKPKFSSAKIQDLSDQELQNKSDSDKNSWGVPQEKRETIENTPKSFMLQSFDKQEPLTPIKKKKKNKMKVQQF